MDIAAVRALITVPDRDMVPPPDLFLHASVVHGQAHVARVLVHALRLIEATGFVGETAGLWAAVYLHDIARQHDGYCTRHGHDAWMRLADVPHVRDLFGRGGVREDDYPAIEFAVTIHCSGEPSPSDSYYRLAALLKDADGLDRVRLGDLKPHMLRHESARSMVGFAQRLHDETNWILQPGPDYFARLWPEVIRMSPSFRG
jgi:hypothetical protein